MKQNEEQKKERFPYSSMPEQDGSHISGAVNADLNAAAVETHLDKFHAAQGHGYAAEQANNLYDILTGKDAKIVGGDNAKNGPDRRISGVNIQTKYYQTASQSVAAAFENGQYRYLNPDGSPMQLEVPQEQYTDVVKAMARRIERGEVPGITNPADAKSLVREGHFTYNQARNITKFGTVESLTFDAVNGAVVCTSAFGITATLAFAQSIWSGESVDIAVERASYAGIKTGGAAFANTVITSQLMRTGLNQALLGPTNSIVKLLGPKSSVIIANALRDGANIYGAAAMNSVSKLLRGNILTTTAMTIVLSAKDIGNAFRGRISGQQLFKNLTTTAAGMAAGTAGFIAGKFVLNLIAPGTGKVAGLIVGAASAAGGGTIGGSVTNRVIGKFIEDDAVALTKMIEDSFCQMAQDYMLSQEEVDIVLDDLALELSGEKLLEMYASPNHQAYADDLVEGQIERLVRGRCRIYLPTEADMIRGIGRLVEDAEQRTGIFSFDVSGQPDPVEIGRQLTGKELSPQAARKAWYATKQMNIAQTQAERRLRKMNADEEAFQEEREKIHSERDSLKNQIQELLNQ